MAFILSHEVSCGGTPEATLTTRTTCTDDCANDTLSVSKCTAHPFVDTFTFQCCPVANDSTVGIEARADAHSSICSGVDKIYRRSSVDANLVSQQEKTFWASELLNSIPWETPGDIRLTEILVLGF